MSFWRVFLKIFPSFVLSTLSAKNSLFHSPKNNNNLEKLRWRRRPPPRPPAPLRLPLHAVPRREDQACPGDEVLHHRQGHEGRLRRRRAGCLPPPSSCCSFFFFFFIFFSFSFFFLCSPVPGRCGRRPRHDTLPRVLQGLEVHEPRLRLRRPPPARRPAADEGRLLPRPRLGGEQVP